MGRKPRGKICGGIYHVMNRGNRKALIFEDDRDRRRFLQILIEQKETYGVHLLAGCEMRNHFHAVVSTPHGNLSEFMEQWQGCFARYSNWRHERVGHLFQGRFRDVLIEHDMHLLIALCYVFFNPVGAGFVKRLEDYKWSTYAATVGLAPLPDYLSLDWLEALFPGESRQESQLRFRNLMAEAKPALAYLRQDEAGVDPNSVRRVIRSYAGEQFRLENVPRTYRSLLRSSLTELLHEGMTATMRAEAIYDARVVHGYKLAEIARELRLSSSAVSKIFRSSTNLRRGRPAC
jgi:putative transposase